MFNTTKTTTQNKALRFNRTISGKGGSVCYMNWKGRRVGMVYKAKRDKVWTIVYIDDTNNGQTKFNTLKSAKDFIRNRSLDFMHQNRLNNMVYNNYS